MRYKTIIKEIKKENAIKFLQEKEKNIISLLGIQAKINIKNDFQFYQITGGFTLNDIEKILNIDLLKYNIAWFASYNYNVSYLKEMQTAFKTSLYTCGIENNHKKRIENNLIQFYCYHKNNNDNEFEKLRKNLKSNYKNIIFYLLIQKETKKEKYVINYTWDRLKILYQGYTYTTFETYNNIKVLDTTLYDIQLDKSGYYNAHIKDLKIKAHEMHLKNLKNSFLNYSGFESDKIIIENKKESILKEFYNISLQCKNKFDFDIFSDISKDIKYFLSDIEKFYKNQKDFSNITEYKKDMEKILNFKIRKKGGFYKECLIHEWIENTIKERIKKDLNKEYYYINISFTTKELKKENNIIIYENTIENIPFKFCYNLDDIKIFSWEV